MVTTTCGSFSVPTDAKPCSYQLNCIYLILLLLGYFKLRRELVPLCVSLSLLLLCYREEFGVFVYLTQALSIALFTTDVVPKQLSRI